VDEKVDPANEAEETKTWTEPDDIRDPWAGER
jgi:hypothetical protein